MFLATWCCPLSIDPPVRPASVFWSQTEQESLILHLHAKYSDIWAFSFYHFSTVSPFLCTTLHLPSFHDLLVLSIEKLQQPGVSSKVENLLLVCSAFSLWAKDLLFLLHLVLQDSQQWCDLYLFLFSGVQPWIILCNFSLFFFWP